MSYTYTYTASDHQKTGNLSLTRRNPTTKASGLAPKLNQGAVALNCGNNRTKHSNSELWKWTLTKDSIASCFVKDIFDMQECDAKGGADFYWLGRVPCRTVRIVGMVVGVLIKEKRTIYSVDDGTGVIDCEHRHTTREDVKKPSSPVKGKRQSDRYKLKQPLKPSDNIPGPSEPPKPLAGVGMSVRVVGRILNRHSDRVMLVDDIEVCKSSNEEPEHWLAVCDLHRTFYYPPNPEPFTIPPPKAIVLTQVPKAASTSSRRTQQNTAEQRPMNEPQTPSGSSACSSASTSPASDASSIHGPQSPPRLRHPSRLHTRDLTANTFRIYIKHYMDNAPPDQDEISSSDEDDEEIRHSLQHIPDTPTKRKAPSSSKVRHRGHDLQSFSDATPRPSKHSRISSSLAVDQTPRASGSGSHYRKAGRFWNQGDEVDEDGETSAMRGYALSHLRRVPELALLARKVVEAEAKRRTREERKKTKELEEQTQSNGKGKAPASSVVSASSTRGHLSKLKSGEGVGPKMKRLFRHAIRQLYDEGSIVLWEGPVRRLTQTILPSLLSFPSSGPSSLGTNRLWKASSSVSTYVGERTIVSSISGISNVSQLDYHEGDIGELSDPPPNEEAYIPLTTAYLAKMVERAITEIQSLRSRTSSRMSGPPPGPTPSEILNHMKRKDERWARVGEWAVNEALGFAKAEGRVWCVGQGRWEVCG